MPRTKKGYKKNRKAPKGYYKSILHKKMSVADVANHAWQGVKYLKKMINTEVKCVDASANVSVDYNGAITQINQITQGLTDANRVGDSVKMQTLTLRGAITRNGADAKVRLIVYMDKQNSTSAVADILQATGSIYAVLSPKNYDKRFKSKILYDHLYVVDTNNPIRQFDLVIPIHQHTQYEAGGAATVDTGKLCYLLISDVVTTNLPGVSSYSRLTYTDD